MFCSKCGNSNEGSAKFCSSCGAPLIQDGLNLSEKDNATENSEEFYKAAIGPKNQGFYIRHFQRFESDGRVGASWNWPAFFITFYWLLYRKMWLYALIYFFLPYIAMIPLGIAGGMAGNSGVTVTSVGYTLYLGSIFFLVPIYANALYFRHCKKKIIDASSSSKDFQRQLGEVAGKGGTSNVALIAFIPVFIAVIGILAAIAIPTYQDYVTRAGLAEAVSIGDSATESVSKYYYQHQTVPSSLKDAGFLQPMPSSVKEMVVNGENGIVSLIISKAPIEGKTLLLIPSLDESNKIVWKCMSQEIQDKYLPHKCREQ